MDLSIKLNGTRLNLRVGAVLTCGGRAVVEVSLIGANSCLPGGRVRLCEHSLDALVRELREETGISFDRDRFRQLTVIENFFVLDGEPFHELFFLYAARITAEELEGICSLNRNLDNSTTRFVAALPKELDALCLLPEAVHGYVRSEAIEE